MAVSNVRVRFAPSPTGFLHVGNARTALFNYLYARSTGGAFLLRVEDTDLERSTTEYEEALIEDLGWLGLEWDEGPDVGGSHGPYRQSERLDVYRRQLDTLISAGKVYKCYCTPDELEARRTRAVSAGAPAVYNGRCRRLSAAERSRLEVQGRTATYRYRVPDEKIVVEDLVRGRVEFDGSLIGDVILAKSDGMPTFHFAVTVDDALMGITCVLRGEGHLSNAPVQAFLARDLGFDPPLFAHMSQTLAPGGGKLSKRRGAMSLREFRQRGYLPEAVVNYMALLGWSPGGGVEIFTLEEAVGLFEVGDLSKASAFFDPQKFSFICRRHMRRADGKRLARLAGPFLEGSGLPVSEPAYLERLATLARRHAEKIEDFVDTLRPYLEEGVFDKDAVRVLREEGAPGVIAAFTESLQSRGGVSETDVKGAFEKAREATGRKGRALYMPVRAALTGSTNGAEILEIMPVLAFARVMARLEGALDRLEGEGEVFRLDIKDVGNYT